MARTLSNQIFSGDSSPSPARAGLVPEAGPATQDYFHKFDGEGVQELDSAGRAPESAGVGRSRERRNSVTSFPPSLCTLAGEESCPDDPKEEVLSATQHHNRGLAQYPPATSVCEPAESERGEPLSVSDESGWNLQRVRLLTLSSPPVESGAEQGATLVSAPGFLPRKFSWASDEDCESLAAAQAGMIGGMQ